MKPRFRRLTLVAALIGAGLASGCGGATSSPVLVASGTTQGVAWDLWAWEQEGSLCMWTGSAAGPFGGEITPSPNAMEGGQCEYDDKHQGATYYMGAEGGEDTAGNFTASLAFGPLPANATRIEVASRLILTTQPFPSGKGLPSGRFWVWAGPFDPPASQGIVLDTPRPLDAHGKPVAFQDF